MADKIPLLGMGGIAEGIGTEAAAEAGAEAAGEATGGSYLDMLGNYANSMDKPLFKLVFKVRTES